MGANIGTSIDRKGDPEAELQNRERRRRSTLPHLPHLPHLPNHDRERQELRPGYIDIEVNDCDLVAALRPDAELNTLNHRLVTRLNEEVVADGGGEEMPLKVGDASCIGVCFLNFRLSDGRAFEKVKFHVLDRGPDAADAVEDIEQVVLGGDMVFRVRHLSEWGPPGSHCIHVGTRRVSNNSPNCEANNC